MWRVLVIFSMVFIYFNARVSNAAEVAVTSQASQVCASGLGGGKLGCAGGGGQGSRPATASARLPNPACCRNLLQGQYTAPYQL